MIGYNFAGSRFGSLSKCHLLITPRSSDHSGLALFLMSHGAGNQISHAVHHSHLEAYIVGKCQCNCLCRHKFRLCCRYGFAASALRQLVKHPLPDIEIIHIRKHHKIHKSFDESRLACSDGAHHPCIYAALCSFRYISVYI